MLGAWMETDSGLVGSGALYGLDRTRLQQGQFFVPPDSIALLETARNSVTGAGLSIGFMGVWSVLWTAVTIQCLSDPKSCFGSCPTFYAEDSTGREVLQAEGFSASIARALEARDVDALYRGHVTGDRFTIRMTNEALETHAVRTLRLHAVPRHDGGHVYGGVDGQYYPAEYTLPPASCTAAEGDCLAAVTAFDTLERHSPSDSTDLAAREVVELEFAGVPEHAGLVLAARQSLVSTFVFYQTVAYLGRQAGDWLATLERTGPEEARRSMGMARALGGIEILVQDPSGVWRAAGSYDEAGPIATDVVVVPIGPHAPGPLRLRLRLARGGWRLNYVALAALGNPVAPVVLEPVAVERRGSPDPEALRRLRNPDVYLVTYPGDEYRITFTLPADMRNPELFLESQGYYYEWMRSEWLAEEDPVMASLALGDPAEALRQLAPKFKRVEPRMERLFWESRYGR